QGSGLLYSTLLGGSNFDYGHGITLDTSGNAYVIGNTGSSDFPTTAVAFDITSGHGVFVTKLNSQGSGLLYSTFLSGSSGDYGWDIALDTSGNAYVVGNTQSSDFPITAEAFDVTFNGGLDDVFVTKLATTDTISPTPSKIVGWGGYNNASFFNFNIFSNNKYPVGIFYYSDRTIGSLWSNQITRLTVSFDKKKAIFNGNIKIGGIAGYKFIVYVDDNGNPGTNDKFKIIIYDPINILVYTSNGTLFTGNIQIYP
ncbi:MAG: SBBP repeat-containing protein, partial [Actinobacteria bacterium]|nr:SBBP repeat-containing protein [Actinomycetota bacterium]